MSDVLKAARQADDHSRHLKPMDHDAALRITVGPRHAIVPKPKKK